MKTQMTTCDICKKAIEDEHNLSVNLRATCVGKSVIPSGVSIDVCRTCLCKLGFSIAGIEKSDIETILRNIVAEFTRIGRGPAYLKPLASIKKIRVLRVIEYLGDEEAVLDILKHSIHGVKFVLDGKVEIRVSTVGVVPDQLPYNFGLEENK